jgi:next-to-BRCA1 protein 1
VPAQHPGHGFARLRDPTDLKLPSIPFDVHRAGCNSCGSVIRGTRYKCMHPSCKDFDLCANCEALPIPVHPIAHAMLKIRQPGIYIPVVKRYGMEGGPIPIVVGAPSSHESPEEDARKGVNDPFADLPRFQVPSALPVPSTILTPIAPSIPLPETSPIPTTVPVHSESEPNAHGKTAKGTASFTFGSPVFNEDDPSHSGRYTPTTAAPLLPAPSPPPALATEFIRSVPFLHQDGQYIQERVTSLPTPDVRTEPWWGQSTWIPPTPPAPLPVPLRTPSTPQRSRSPDPLIHFDTATSTSAPTLVTASILGPKSDSGNSHASLPQVPPTDFNELFDLASQFRHLLELPPVVTPVSLPVQPRETLVESEPEPALTEVDEGGVPTELASTQVDDTDTPLSLVALLSKPEKTPRPGVFDAISPGRLLSQLLDSPSATSLSSHVEKTKTVEQDAPLRASFVMDNNIPDGQIFPPGAEFVKSWRMRNDGPSSWPAETELVFVAGDKLVIDKTERFKVGSVSPGEEVDVWTGEMKAPDVPGKYITYWRLCDSKGRRFGHSIWVE